MTIPTRPAGNGVSRLMLPALALAAIGASFHNVREFPGAASLVPQAVILFLAVALGVWWAARPGPAARWAIIVWALFNLVLVATLAVLPLSIWPWDPEQSAAHYTSHVVYVVTQIPLLIVALQSRPTRTATA